MDDLDAGEGGQATAGLARQVRSSLDTNDPIAAFSQGSCRKAWP
jgi:hypothetical protein